MEILMDFRERVYSLSIVGLIKPTKPASGSNPDAATNENQRDQAKLFDPFLFHEMIRREIEKCF